MSSRPVYCIDANFFLNLKYFYFMDVFVSLKSNLETLAQEERIVISKAVLDELERKEDEIFSWVKSTFPRVEDIDVDQANILPDIVDKNSTWTEGERTPADPIVIALAETKGYIVVTHEKKSPFNHGANNRIPAVCEHRSVNCLHTNEFFKEEGWLF